MECEEVRSQLPDYLKGGLEESRRLDIDSHLTTCPDCSTDLEPQKDVWMRLRSLPLAEPSPALQARFDAMIDVYREGAAESQQGWWSRANAWLAGWWPRQPAWQMGIALVLLASGMAAGQYFATAPPPNPEMSQLREEIRDMRQMVAMSLLQQQSAVERLRGINWTSRIDQPDMNMLTALLETLRRDPNVSVRLAAVDALRPFNGRPEVRQGFVESLVSQDSPMVQVALIDLLVEFRNRDSVNVLQQLKQDLKVHETVRERAEWGIAQLN